MLLGEPLILAHGVGRVYELPLPLPLYLGGAALTVLASFLVRAFVRSVPPERPAKPVAGPRAAARLLGFFRVTGLVVFGLILLSSTLLADRYFRFASLFFWIGVIILSTVVCAVVSGVWERANPWRTIEGFYRLEDAPPATSARPPWWLGPLLLYGLFWFELVSGSGFDPLPILIVMLGYTVFALAYQSRWGEAWATADPLSILFGFAGRLAVFEVDEEGIRRRRVTDGLDEPDPTPLALFASVFILLASTTLDNLRETVQWFDFLRASGLDSLSGKVVDSAGLLLLTLPFLIPFMGAVWFASRYGSGDIGYWALARRFGWSLIPIGVAYVLAHNMPLVFTGLPQLAEPLSESLAAYSPSPALIWFLEIALIVGGHVLGVLAAHRTALRVTGSHPGAVASHIALTLLMSFYTVATLWLLSLPLVV